MTNKGLKIINIALAVAFVAAGIYVFYTSPNKSVTSILDSPKSGSTINPTANKSENNGNTENARDNNSPITKLLFGENSASSIEITSIPATPLPAWFKLKGTITGPDNLARAIMKLEREESSTKVSILKIGDDAGEGFILKEVKKDYVVFENNGHQAKLWIKEEKTYSDLTPKTNTTISHTSEPLGELQLPEKKGENRQVLDSMAVDSDWVEVKDERQNTVGLLLENIKPLSPLAMTGLQNGDIVKSINNQQLTGFQKAYQVLKKAKYQNILEIEVVRNDEIKLFKTKLE